jgi:DNA-binding transcriptional LysR family regulator
MKHGHRTRRNLLGNCFDFVRASELNVGQTTVSARMRLLEQQLGRSLFVRNKSAAALTRLASGFCGMRRRSCNCGSGRHQVALPRGHGAALTIAREVTSSQPFSLDWVLWMRRSLPDILPQDLINQVAAELVDDAIIFARLNPP